MLVAIHPIAKSSGLLAKFQLKIKSRKKSDETIYNKINAVLFPKTATMTTSPVKSLNSQAVTSFKMVCTSMPIEYKVYDNFHIYVWGKSRYLSKTDTSHKKIFIRKVIIKLEV